MEVLGLDKPATMSDLTCIPGTRRMLHRHLRGLPASSHPPVSVIQSQFRLICRLSYLARSNGTAIVGGETQ